MLIWKTRIGTLKPLAVFGTIVSGLFVLLAIANLALTFQNPGGQPRTVRIEEIATAKIPSGTYVTVTGTVLNDPDVQSDAEKSGSFFLADTRTSSLVMVKSNSFIQLPDGQELTLTGIVHRITPAQESRLATAVPGLEARQLAVNAQVYLSEGEQPLQTSAALLTTLGWALLLAICIVAMTFPASLFVPQPVEKEFAPPSEEDERPQRRLTATGLFQKLENNTPPYQFEKETKGCENVSATFERAGDWFVIKYKHYKRVKLFGFVTSNIIESDWAIALDHDCAPAVEAGRLFAWTKKPALRIRYTNRQGKSQLLLLTFKNAAMWTSCIEILEDLRLM